MGNRTKDNLLTVRCNDEEYALIKRLAEKRGQSMSDFIRTLVKENEVNPWEKQAKMIQVMIDAALAARGMK